MDIKYYFECTFVPLEQIPVKSGRGARFCRKYIAENYTKAERKARSTECYRRSKMGKLNPYYGVCGSDHSKYLSAPKPDCKGYLLVVKPVWYTGRKKSHHVFQHSAIWCAFTGVTEVPAGHGIHHCDQDKTNNAFDNLICVSKAEHVAIHNWIGGATTISKESTAKWLEAHRPLNKGVI